MKIKQDIIFFDNDILVINKPSGSLSIPGGFSPDAVVIKNELEKTFGKLFVVHRLDKETSGIMLFARNADSHRDLNIQFEKRLIKKEYVAIVEGFPLWKKQQIDLSLKPNGDRRHRTIIDTQGKSAITDIVVVQRTHRHSLFLIKPRTGITHQIRCHLAGLGFPIVGDQLYRHYCQLTKSKSSLRIFLHASKICFMHPESHQKVTFSCPPPAVFNEILIT